MRCILDFTVFMSMMTLIEPNSPDTVTRSIERTSGQPLIDYINSQQNLWKAERNLFFESMSDEMKHNFFTVFESPLSEKVKKMKPFMGHDDSIPEFFDARNRWPNCSSIKDIRDQSACGSGWVIAPVEAISDRTCIASNGTTQVTISALDALTCCEYCGRGCDGGGAFYAWWYWVNIGIVSGGGYIEDTGCQPYPFPPCMHYSNESFSCPSDMYIIPKCRKNCQDGYSKSFGEDKYYGENYYYFLEEATIQRDILEYGPLAASFNIYEDFLTYKSGIYKPNPFLILYSPFKRSTVYAVKAKRFKHVAGINLGRHSVKVIGWGVENQTKYWLAANSWNSGWGENGFFRILRGTDECKFESEGIGGIPK